MPVREVSNRGGNAIQLFSSLKMDRLIACESLIERDLACLLDFEQEVVRFTEQPLTIEYTHAGKTLHYTPDFHAVLWVGRNILFECKPQKVVHLDKNQRKFAAGQAWCAERGWLFQVVTDELLRSGFRLRNVKRLTQFARYEIGADVKDRIRALLAAAREPLPVADLLTAAAPDHPQTMMIPLLHMAYHHEVVLPLDDAPLAADSLVTLPGTTGSAPGRGVLAALLAGLPPAQVQGGNE